MDKSFVFDIVIVFAHVISCIKNLQRWSFPLSQHISAISFLFAKIAHSRISDVSQ